MYRRRRLMRLEGAGVSEKKIYGVSWGHDVSSPTLTRTDDAVGMVAAAGVGSTPVINNFDAAEIYKDIVDVTDALGNVFVRIPKFYIKKTDDGSTATWQISRYQHAGFYLPWCFWNFTTSSELPYIDIGKYNASLSGDNKLESKSGTYPLINKTIVDFRTYARNNGGGYGQIDIHVVDVLQTLFLVEFATLNGQSVMLGFTNGQYTASHVATVAETGNRIIVANATAALFFVGQTVSVGTSLGGNQVFYGRTITAIDTYDVSNKAITFDGAAATIAVGNVLYNTGWKSGFSASIVAKSGSLSSNTDGKNPCMYRGIENPWGSVWQFVDGVNINERQAWVCRDQSDYASNLFANPYSQLSYVNHNANGYSTAMGFDPGNPYAQFPSNIGGGSTTYYSDYYYQDTGQRAALLGGYWIDGSSAGPFYWNLSGASSFASVRIGGRLLKKPL